MLEEMNLQVVMDYLNLIPTLEDEEYDEIFSLSEAGDPAKHASFLAGYEIGRREVATATGGMINELRE